MTNLRFVIEEMWNPLVTNPDISSLTNLRFVTKGFHISNISSIPNIPYKDHTRHHLTSRRDVQVMLEDLLVGMIVQGCQGYKSKICMYGML